MSVPHGGDLAIMTPRGKFLFVCYFQGPDEVPPLVEVDAFSRMAELTLDPSTAEATDWNAEPRVKTRIFRDTGWYRVVLSDNLETDEPETEECVIHFSPNAKR